MGYYIIDKPETMKKPILIFFTLEISSEEIKVMAFIYCLSGIAQSSCGEVKKKYRC